MVDRGERGAPMTVAGFSLTVPSPAQAETRTRELFGERVSRLLRFDPLSEAGGGGDLPRVVDAGCNHMCVRVVDVDAASRALAAQPDIAVLGCPLEVPDGALAGFRWQYFRMPWGGFFEVQQWAEPPRDPRADSLASETGLDPTASIPGVVGFDHAGYAVTDLSRALAAFEALGGKHVLGSVGNATREVMLAQFELDAADALHMAMVRVGDVNFELFQHEVADIVGEPQRTRSPRPGEAGASAVRVAARVDRDVAIELEQLGVKVRDKR